MHLTSRRMMAYSLRILVVTLFAVPTIAFNETLDQYQPQPRPKQKHRNVHFLGVGYNIIDGNPGGRDLDDGGVDPGLKTTRLIIQHTYKQEKLTDDHQYLLPDYVIYRARDLSSETCTSHAIHGMESYQEELSEQTTIEVGFSTLFKRVRFGGSGGFRTMQRYVNEDQKLFVALKTLEILGEGRIQVDLDSIYFTEEFASVVCRLPARYSRSEEKEEYFQFLDKWGTHVLTKASFGYVKNIYLQYKQSSIVYTQAREIRGGAILGGTYNGFHGAIGVSGSHNINFEELTTAYENIKIESTRGSEETNEPIKYVLAPMDDILRRVHLPPLNQSCIPVEDLANNLGQAFLDYPEYKGVNNASDPEVYWQPLTWPDGTYTLPQTSSGCPEGGVSWASGWRLFDTHNDKANNRWTPDNIHLQLPVNSRSEVKMTFCTKAVPQSSDYRREWQSGTYCVFQHGRSCPDGFESGSIFWDDQNFGNGNDHHGVLPDGIYDTNTNMSFCCRSDNEPSKQIILPVDHDFMLMTPTGHCQQVFGMTVSRETYLWDSAGESAANGSVPYPGITGNVKDVNITFCYYERDTGVISVDTRFTSSSTSTDIWDASTTFARSRRSAGGAIPGTCDFYLGMAAPAATATAIPTAPDLPVVSFLMLASLAIIMM